MDRQTPVNTGPEGGVVHLRAAQVHEDSAARHEAAAGAWAAWGNVPQAEFERRCAAREREFVVLEADRAALQRLRARSLSQEDEVARVEIERLSSEISRRAAKLGADAADMERQRATLRNERHPADRRQVPAPRVEIADELVRHEATDSSADAATQPATAGLERDVGYAASRLRHRARSLSEVFGRAAEVLEDSATLAEDHAARQDRAGRSDAAEHERHLASRAREAAQRARLHAEEYLEFGARQERSSH